MKCMMLQHYDITITDDQPFLLTVRPSARDQRRAEGRATNIYLVPELCVLTGQLAQNLL